MHQGSVFSVKKGAIEIGAKPFLNAADVIPKPSKECIVGWPMWINDVTKASAQTTVLASWPGPGRQESVPLLANKGNDAGGCVVHLNIYPPSSDSDTAPASSLWNPSAIDMRHLMHWAIDVANPPRLHTRRHLVLLMLKMGW